MLLGASAAGMVASLIAVEGDPEYLRYLDDNLAVVGFPTSVWPTYVSQSGEALPTAVRFHAGTATLRGEDWTNSRRLDDVWLSEGSPRIDVVKIDTEGHDGRVLAGATDMLAECKPLVIFEWQPRCLVETGSDPQQAFEVLAGEDYDRFVWFDKYGEFSHIDVGHSPESVRALDGVLFGVTVAARLALQRCCTPARIIPSPRSSCPISCVLERKSRR